MTAHGLRTLSAHSLALLALAACSGTRPPDSTPEPAAPGRAQAAAPERAPHHDRPGLAAFLHGGRLWVFPEGSPDLAEFLAHGEPAKSVSWVGEGPSGLTLRSTEQATLWAYVAHRPGFRVFRDEKNGHLWIFREGSKGLEEFLAHGEPAKAVLWIGEGPRGATIRSDEAETLQAYRSEP